MENPISKSLLRHIAWVVAIAILALSGCRKSNAQQAVPALPEKAVLTEQSADLRKLIDAELASGKKRIVIPPGRYRVQAERGGHLQFKNL